MTRVLAVLLLASATLCAQSAAPARSAPAQPTIDLAKYKANAKKYAYAEAVYPIGKHTYTLVNVKPKTPAGDTACISALVIDKRKFVMVDLLSAGGAGGLVVPKSQPISGGLIVIKASPIEAKTFIILPTGKVATLPGASVLVDTVNKTVYTVWNNAGTFMLTALDYDVVRLLINSLVIVEPAQWYTDGTSCLFSAKGEKGYYSVDLFGKSVNKLEKVEGKLTTLTYVADLQSLDAAKCCGADVLKP